MKPVNHLLWILLDPGFITFLSHSQYSKLLLVLLPVVNSFKIRFSNSPLCNLLLYTCTYVEQICVSVTHSLK